MIRAMDLPARRTEITVYRYQKERMRTAATTPASAARTLLLLAAAVLFVVTGWAAAPVQAHPSSFSDVPDSGSVHQAVEYMAAAGMLSGYPDGTFGPNKQLNRGQAAKILSLSRASSRWTPLPTSSATWKPYTAPTWRRRRTRGGSADTRTVPSVRMNLSSVSTWR